jgi:hypothetical protein
MLKRFIGLMILMSISCSAIGKEIIYVAPKIDAYGNRNASTKNVEKAVKSLDYNKIIQSIISNQGRHFSGKRLNIQIKKPSDFYDKLDEDAEIFLEDYAGSVGADLVIYGIIRLDSKRNSFSVLLEGFDTASTLSDSATHVDFDVSFKDEEYLEEIMTQGIFDIINNIIQ